MFYVNISPIFMKLHADTCSDETQCYMFLNVRLNFRFQAVNEQMNFVKSVDPFSKKSFQLSITENIIFTEYMRIYDTMFQHCGVSAQNFMKTRQILAKKKNLTFSRLH